MKTFISLLSTSALLGLLFVTPFMLLEWVNRRSFNEAYPFGLFFIMWLLPALFFLILTPMILILQTGIIHMANPVSLAIRITLLVLLAVVWVSFVTDQMPCFMGVPICD